MPEVINERTVFTPSEVNAKAKAALRQFSFWVRGEVSDFSTNSRWFYSYITLKDDRAQLKCVARPSFLATLPFTIEKGKEILVFGTLSIYESGGEFQMEVAHIEELGVGTLQKKIEELKQKLQKEGLFDISRKRTLPAFPERIGVITSSSGEGAAWSDVVKVAQTRFPGIELVLADVFVQGEKAPLSIMEALKALNERNDIDVIILTRGGGAVESLMLFSLDELLIRAISSSRIPIVCAIGHEKDVSTAELVADARASNPSLATAMVLRDRKDLLQRIDEISRRIQRAIKHFAELPVRLEELRKTIVRRYLNLIKAKHTRIQELIGRIQAVGPKATLSRGYSIVYAFLPAKKIVKKAGEVSEGNEIMIRFSEGKVAAEVKKLIQEQNNGK